MVCEELTNSPSSCRERDNSCSYTAHFQKPQTRTVYLHKTWFSMISTKWECLLGFPVVKTSHVEDLESFPFCQWASFRFHICISSLHAWWLREHRQQIQHPLTDEPIVHIQFLLYKVSGYLGKEASPVLCDNIRLWVHVAYAFFFPVNIVRLELFQKEHAAAFLWDP